MSRFEAASPSPVEVARKAGPLGKGDWPGWSVVYDRIDLAAAKMGRNKRTYLGQDHIETMADLGSGHEERMKARVQWLIAYGWLTNEDLAKTAMGTESKSSV